MWPYSTTKQPEKITDISSISSRPNRFPRGMTSDGQAQKIPYWWRVTIYAFWLVAPGRKFASTNQKHYPDLGSDKSSAWNFYAWSPGRRLFSQASHKVAEWNF